MGSLSEMTHLFISEKIVEEVCIDLSKKTKPVFTCSSDKRKTERMLRPKNRMHLQGFLKQWVEIMEATTRGQVINSLHNPFLQQ
jgi:hypothetical protein